MVKCELCGEMKEETSPDFKSVRHEHYSSKGIVKRFYLKCEVIDVITHKPKSACHDCKIILSSEMAAGGNLESMEE